MPPTHTRLEIEQVDSGPLIGTPCDASNCDTPLSTMCWWSPFAEDVFYCASQCAHTALAGA
jgi:hypothetical protein